MIAAALKHVGFGCIAYMAIALQSAVLPTADSMILAQASLASIMIGLAVMMFTDVSAMIWTAILCLAVGITTDVPPGIMLIIAGLSFGTCRAILPRHASVPSLSSLLAVCLTTALICLSQVADRVAGGEIDIAGSFEFGTLVGLPVLASLACSTTLLIVFHGLKSLLWDSHRIQEAR